MAARGGGFHLGQGGVGAGEARGVQRRLEPGLPKRRDLGLADAPGAEHAGVARAEDLADAQRLGGLAGDLAGGAAEGGERVVARVEAALGGDAAHGLGHLLDRDGDEALGGGLDALRAHGRGEFGQARAGGGGIERARRPSARTPRGRSADRGGPAPGWRR